MWPDHAGAVNAKNRSQRSIRFWVLTHVSLLGWVSWSLPPLAWAESQEVVTLDEPGPDWPVVITQLRQQLDHLPGHAATRKQLAIAYNNYGISLAEQGQWTVAVAQLEEAMRIDTSDAKFQTNLARIYLQQANLLYEAHQAEDAKAAISKATALAPQEANAYALLGELEYYSQHLKEAKAAWERALALDPNLEDVRKKLEQLNQELPIESKFERLSQAYFDIRYTEELDRSSGFDIRDALLKARREVGSDFAYWPSRKVVVLVYSAEQFRRLRQDTPDWIAGQYDGKIRVPLPGPSLDPQTVHRTLVHEYTHALVHAVTNNRCPTWLNEGLAEYEAWKDQAPPWRFLRPARAQQRLIPWTDLSAQFSTELSQQNVLLAYEQSQSIVRYLVERYGFWKIRRVLKALASGTALDAALTEEVHLKPAKLEARWRTWLEEALAVVAQ